MLNYEIYKMYNDLYARGNERTAFAVLSGIFPGLSTIFNK